MGKRKRELVRKKKTKKTDEQQPSLKGAQREFGSARKGSDVHRAFLNMLTRNI
jgi:hypothetical protein